MRYFTAATLAALTTFFLVGTASAQTLKTQKFPDGSGHIGVAPDWKLDDGGAGGAELSGPAGAKMYLGQFRFVLAHNFDQLTLTPGVNPEVPRVHLDDPVRTFIEATALLQKAGLVSKLKIKGVEPAPWFTVGRAATIRYSFVSNGINQDIPGGTVDALRPARGTIAAAGTFSENFKHRHRSGVAGALSQRSQHVL